MHIDVETTTTTTIPSVFESQILEKIIEPHVPETQITDIPQETPFPNLNTNDYAVLNQNLENILLLSPISIETLSPDSSPIISNYLIIHPLYKPLTMDEIIIPSDLMLPILETLTRNSIDIERPSELIPRSELNKIQIKPLRRPKPSVPLPYKKPYQFFKNSEPDLELLANAFHKSLMYMGGACKPPLTIIKLRGELANLYL
ncbi:hypothetical protein P8452_56804 [Trifolium repens]|jgi:hypothetical protein|nr:hypothetical protein P8452_56804 [Trifolium repens]